MRASLAAAAVLLCLGAATAHAKTRPTRPGGATPSKRYWIERIEVDGIADEGTRALFRERVWNALELVLANEGQELVPVSEVERAIAEAPESRACRDQSCRIALGERLKASRILNLSVEQRSDDRSRGAWIITWDLFALDSFERVLHKEVACSACNDAQTLDTVLASFPTVLAEQQIVQTCRAHVETTPSGAEVTLDGIRVGTTPFDHALSARAHDLVIARSGFQTAKIALRCEAGRREVFNLRLARDRALIADERDERGAAPNPALVSPALSHAMPAPRPKSSTRRTALLATGGVSLALCVASLALLGSALAYDGRSGTEGGASYHYDTQGGVILGGIGAGVFGALGIGLIVAGARTEVAR